MEQAKQPRYDKRARFVNHQNFIFNTKSSLAIITSNFPPYLTNLFFLTGKQTKD